MSQRLYISGLGKFQKNGPAGKPSVKSAKSRKRYVVYVRPEAKRACPEQGEVGVKPHGGPNWWVVQHPRMTWDKK